MEGGGGGKGGGGGFGYGNLQNNPPLYKLSPPLTAIGRFLWGQNYIFSQQQTQNNVKNKQTLVSPNGFCDFSSFSGAIGSYDASGVSWSSRNDMSFFDGLFLDGGTSAWTHERNPNVGLKEEVKLAEKNSRKAGKRVKGGSSSTLIKGQWTEEEDRKLIRLVKQYGERKWAQIAEKMVGRAGKQCRERWHNHLRPDIKKDGWSEEEERLLIEAHQNVGNRWAEIAKRIPGRTENTIKNHFNATKRRQNSRRKSKQLAEGQSAKSKSSILQNYIKSKNLNDSSTTITPSHSTSPTGSSLSEDPILINQLNSFLHEPSESTTDDSPPLITHTYDDELLFMQNFFENNNYNHQSVDNGGIIGLKEVETYQTNGDHHLKNSSVFNPLDLYQTNVDHQPTEISDSAGFSSSTSNLNMYINNFQEEVTPSTHLYSDLYLSYLLHGATSSSSTNFYYDNMKMDLLTDQNSANLKKEMDLIEMVSSSQFSQGSNSSF